MKRSIVYAAILLISGISTAYAADKALSSQGKKFVGQAAEGGMAEVQLGKLAEKKAQSKDVKEFGARMAVDHAKASDELKALAQQKNEKLPSKLDSKDKALMDKLSKATGADFDKEYMTAMVKDHAKDVTEFQNAAGKLKDPDLKAWVDKTLPVLREHLQQAKDVGQKAGIDVNQAMHEGQQEARTEAQNQG